MSQNLDVSQGCNSGSNPAANANKSSTYQGVQPQNCRFGQFPPCLRMDLMRLGAIFEKVRDWQLRGEAEMQLTNLVSLLVEDEPARQPGRHAPRWLNVAKKRPSHSLAQESTKPTLPARLPLAAANRPRLQTVHASLADQGFSVRAGGRGRGSVGMSSQRPHRVW